MYKIYGLDGYENENSYAKLTIFLSEKSDLRLCHTSDSHAAALLPTFAPQISGFRIRSRTPPQILYKLVTYNGGTELKTTKFKFQN